MLINSQSEFGQENDVSIFGVAVMGLMPNLLWSGSNVTWGCHSGTVDGNRIPPGSGEQMLEKAAGFRIEQEGKRATCLSH